jgi:hypothetical protein
MDCVVLLPAAVQRQQSRCCSFVVAIGDATTLCYTLFGARCCQHAVLLTEVLLGHVSLYLTQWALLLALHRHCCCPKRLAQTIVGLTKCICCSKTWQFWCAQRAYQTYQQRQQH